MKIDLGILSRHRGELMGISILLIMLEHCFMGMYSDVFLKLVRNGEIGVELFMLLSGMGIFFSLDNNPHAGQFYKRRFKRILPSYLMVVGGFFCWQDLVKEFKPVDFLSNLFRIPFFTQGNRWFWFFVLIVVCYLVAPLFYRWIKEGRFKLWHVLLLLLVVGVGCYFMDPSGVVRSLRLLLFRIPSFLLGMLLGMRIKENPVFEAGPSIVALSGVAVFLFVLIALRHFMPELKFTVFFFSAPVLLFLFALLFEACARNAGWLNRAFGFLGALTWECYLLHETFFLRYVKGFISNPLAWTLVSIAITVPVAWVVNRLSGWLQSKI